ncbi:ESPR-type extended signal peptide-containing protein [Acinetobacter faecalis]|uniref:ESPR-type extended signal peptide-containing protein n=1 Tax=Acinetobacter faecalis TaxID=2665161 RepID=UPI002A91ADAF|nr:ESPR-type extended signal peptide-containing protein [Acinetobacter faecalis]MDY6481127.1 ESPR-type extended signal peptide-containing protein [Acinetobacter faecalis]
MNHIYRIIWNETLGAWVAVAENVKRKGKRSSKAVLKSVIALSVLGGASVHASVSCSSGGGNTCTPSDNNFQQTIVLSKETTTAVGAIISGDNGSNGRIGVLFVPPTGGGKGETVGSVTYSVYKTDYDSTNNILTVTYKSDVGNAAFTRIFTPINNSSDKTYLFDESKLMAVVKQTGSIIDGSFVSDGITALPESDESVKIFESDSQVKITSEKYGWTIEESNAGDAAGGGVSIDTSIAGEKVPFRAIVNGQNNTIKLTTSTTNSEKKAAVYSISQGGDGGSGGTYYAGGDGKKGGRGGDASDAEIQVNNLKINIRSSENKGSIGILALSQGGNGGKGGGSYTVVAGGGTGGGGGLGKNASANVTNTTITINDNKSSGIAAMSAAGDGGNGGSAGGIVSSGGKGNTAGQAGAVNVFTDENTTITITGNESNGILAQSIAGAGGNSGSSIGLAALGGNGGMGGNANTATVNSSAKITMIGNESYGITAQSIGGGGGNGGVTAGGISLGSIGGAGGDGDIVDVTNNGELNIVGESSYGILAQSIGGGGGNAGLSAGLASIGGNGGSGGVAGDVIVKNTSTATINTLGKNAHGIVAQSIGGGGGNGGLVVGTVAIGGNGGEGNDAGKVTVKNDADIITGQKDNKEQSDNASAILAQSIGGGGGNGSMAIAAGLGFSLSIGGNGAGGGEGGAVEVNVGENSPTNLTTWGDNSSAIKAQSIGGGGGNGGASVSGSVGSVASASIALGGTGGNGAASGKVEVTTSDTTVIHTFGDRSTGITAQSIGGAGGDGGLAIAAAISSGASVGVSLGGDGGEGAKSDQVHVNNNADIYTKGFDSTGILAQSIGGNGGTGGLSISAAVGTQGASLALGGEGGGGGISKEAFIHNTGTIRTDGAGSSALVSQSIGGSGGNGGGSVTGAFGGGALTFSLGSNGGAGGQAGISKIHSIGNLETVGDNSTAVVAQSIGGTGGNGGFSVAATASGLGGASLALGGAGGGGGKADTVEVRLLSQENLEALPKAINPNKTIILTKGDNSSGVLAQSIGGSGGNGGTAIAASANGNITGGGALSLSFGGKGGKGGQAGKVDLISDHYIQTIGQNASAIVAQSIGGSGGNGGTSVAASVSGSSGPVAVSAAIAIGGEAGDGAFANTVSVANYGDLITVGNHSRGIVAQSIGGNGGNGGLAIGASVSGGATGAVALSSAVGGDGGDANVAEAVTVDNTGNITTVGDFSHGILAQSINGNGGAGGLSVGASVAGSGDKALAATVTLGGKGGDVKKQTDYNNTVTVNNSNNSISTFGNFSDGISAQSIGGNGGVGGLTIGVAAAGSANIAGGVAVGLGGEGGTGGVAGLVTVNNINAAIYTAGKSSHGINAQSIGGNGGNGGVAITGSLAISKETSAALNASVGGTGGDGNNASEVIVISKNSELIQDSATLEDHQKDQTLAYISSIMTKDDSSNGINAQSIGGGGGNGGLAGSFSIAGSLGKSITAAVAIGGNGGVGGLAGNVDVDSFDNITTLGHDSNAILAQSIGGGGGNGGTSVAGSLSVAGGAEGAAYSATVSLGGKGGDVKSTDDDELNTAGLIDVISSGNLVTLGDSSHGVLAQSIGGGGGNGGMSIAISGTASTDSSLQAGASIGGFGGKGGIANNVTVTRGSEGAIYTFGHESTGITAQSIGGGGGNGGSAISLSGSLLDTTSIAFTLGGFGGEGNTGGTVKVDNQSDIFTIGNQSQAIKAQSIGGGGGNGGSSIAFSGTAFTKESSTNIAAAVGGFGVEGGASSFVEVVNQANLYTEGTGAQGILAQSIGGGGGNGGTGFAGTFNPGGFAKNDAKATTLAASVGGFAGNGNISGAVEVNSTGESIYTLGDFSSAIQAQSIGGGGGNGGNATTAALSIKCVDSCDMPDDNKKSDTNISLSVGGFGGNGNVANTVSVKNTSHLTTKGDGSNGIYAQSIGGGGGEGGNALVDAKAINLDERNTTNHKLTLAIGGYKGTGAHADAVDISHSASISTEGLNAKGILAQSIGGGGGNGGNASGATVGIGGGALQEEMAAGIEAVHQLFGDDSFDASSLTGAAGNAGTVTIETTRSVLAEDIYRIMTQGDYSDAIFAQSIGGGGGIGGSATGKLAVGGGAGAGGNANNVLINNEIELRTSGVNSRGIIAQSIGGGGGTGGDVTAQTTVGIGGSGNSAGDGGEVDVTNDAVIITEGYGSEGILAQSIGGGGGTGGSVEQATVAIGGGALENLLSGVGVNASTANGGKGGKVTVVNKKDAEILTKSADSAAIVAQSISGGGGKGGNATGTLALGGFGSLAGESGEVTITNEANLWTEGTNSAGIIAQSIGGGGGIGGHSSGTLTMGGFASTGGASGAVTVENSGQIQTVNTDSTAILAQSIAGGGGLGGGASASVAIGGFGGQGANSNKVSVTNTGNLFTQAKNASAIVAQSISGGGGKGGSSDGGVITEKDGTTTIESAYVAVGGNGANAGKAGDVEVHNSAQLIQTEDDQSNGIVAQSIAGGGGMGGEANGIDITQIINDANQEVLSTFDKGAATVGLGSGAIYTVHNLSNKFANELTETANNIIGTLSAPLVNYFSNLSTAAGGSSSRVIATNAKDSVIYTKGHGSEAIVAQSIAGGGGTTGSAKGILVAGAYKGGAGNASTVKVKNEGVLITEGDHSATIVAQSISGGGGLTSGLDNISSYTVLGGQEETGNSGAVDVENSNILYTAGTLSSAIIAQSISGGGGITGLTHELSFGNTGMSNASATSGKVDLKNTGSITTEGNGAIAVVSQSIGGGGGYTAGVDQGEAPTNESNKGAKGNAGDVNVIHGPHTTTLVAQQTTSTDIDDDSSIEATPIEQFASIFTTGNYAHGIVAQSIAGGGGFTHLIDSEGDISGFFAGTVGGEGQAGNVNIQHDGRIITTGKDSIGILAQSAGSQNGQINVEIAKDSVVIGGSGKGAALALFDGANNYVLNQGYLTAKGEFDSKYLLAPSDPNYIESDNLVDNLVSVGSSDANAIIGSNGNNTIVNDGGFITGSVQLTNGSNKLINQNNGWVLAGTTMQFANELTRMMRVAPQIGSIENDANWSIGGVDEISSTYMVGDFTQTENGKFFLDYNVDRGTSNINASMFSSTNSNLGSFDTMQVNGTADIAGEVNINVMNAGLLMPGEFDLNFITANSVNLSDDLRLVFLPSAISRYQLQNNGNGGVSLVSNYNYVQSGLTANGISVGGVINRIQLGQSITPKEPSMNTRNVVQTPENNHAFEKIAEIIYYSKDIETLQANYDALSGEGAAAIHQSAFTLAKDSLNDISTQMDFWRSKSNLAKSNSSVALTCSSEDATGSSRAELNNCQGDNKWRLWIAGNDGNQVLSGKSNKGIADVKAESNRLIVALDYELDPNTLIGAAFTDGKARYDIKDRSSSGTVDNTGVTFFGIKDFDQYYIKAMLGYDWLKATSARNIFIEGTDQGSTIIDDISNRVEADYKGQMLNTRIEAGYKYLVDGINVTPFIGAQFAMTQYDRAKEKETTGAETHAGLKYEQNRNYSAPLFVGFQLDRNYEFDYGILQPYARFSLNHDLSTDREIESSFVAAPGYTFTVNGGEPQKTSLDLNLGFKMNTNANVAIFGQYNGKFSSSSSKTDHVNFGLEYSW